MYKLSLLLMLLVAANACSDEKKGFIWTRGSGSLALSISDTAGAEHLLWRYNFQPGMKPYFHPLHAPDGTLLTAESPSDHAWHLGLWFCWKYINGLNYWEYQGDPGLAVSEGMTDLKNTRIQTRSDGSAKIRMWIDYHPWDKPDSVVLKEYRLTSVSAPAKDGSYRIEFKHSFTAETDVLLDRTPVQTEPNGVTWGGYAGLSIRFNQELSDPVYFSPELDSMQSGRQASYVAANLTNNKGNQVQLVIIDHPSNPRHPTPWYCIDRPGQRFWFYSPAILYKEPMRLKKGEKLNLGYTVLVPAEPLGRSGIE